MNAHIIFPCYYSIKLHRRGGCSRAPGDSAQKLQLSVVTEDFGVLLNYISAINLCRCVLCVWVCLICILNERHEVTRYDPNICVL